MGERKGQRETAVKLLNMGHLRDIESVPYLEVKSMGQNQVAL